MTKPEAAKLILEERELWTWVIGKFEEKSFWFKNALEMSEACRIAAETLIKEDGR
jgi:hypothetical protein